MQAVDSAAVLASELIPRKAIQVARRHATPKLVGALPNNLRVVATNTSTSPKSVEGASKGVRTCFRDLVVPTLHRGGQVRRICKCKVRGGVLGHVLPVGDQDASVGVGAAGTRG